MHRNSALVRRCAAFTRPDRQTLGGPAGSSGPSDRSSILLSRHSSGTPREAVPQTVLHRTAASRPERRPAAARSRAFARGPCPQIAAAGCARTQPRDSRPSMDGGNQGNVRSSRLPSPPEITLGLVQPQQLALDYLSFWLVPNAVTLARMPAFYGPEVVFHGQRMSIKALMEDKRRFARRWPDRQYQPRRETMRIACDVAAEMCNLRTIVNFVAASPERRRRSQGAITLALDISFADGLPIIVNESSRVIARGAADGDVYDE